MGRRRHQARRAGADALSRIDRTPAARRDLDDIWDYIASDDVDAADAFVDRIEQKLDVLAAHPRIGRDRADLARGVRTFTVGNYLLIYRPLSDGIRLVRVMHGSRNVRAALRDH